MSYSMQLEHQLLILEMFDTEKWRVFTEDDSLLIERRVTFEGAEYWEPYTLRAHQNSPVVTFSHEGKQYTFRAIVIIYLWHTRKIFSDEYFIYPKDWDPDNLQPENIGILHFREYLELRKALPKTHRHKNSKGDTLYRSTPRTKHKRYTKPSKNSVGRPDLLTTMQKKKLAMDYLERRKTQKELAEEYGVSRQTIYRIVKENATLKPIN